jgi:hypothetical protein
VSGEEFECNIAGPDAVGACGPPWADAGHAKDEARQEARKTLSRMAEPLEKPLMDELIKTS